MAHIDKHACDRERRHQDRQEGDRGDDHDRAEAMQEEPPPPAEWAVAAVGLVLLVLSLGYLSFHAITDPRSPPAPVVELMGVEQQQQRFLARVRVSNRGRMSAAQLVVVGQLKQQGQAVEESDTAFAYLAGDSSQEGGLYFSRDPRLFQLELFPRSWQKP